jgi:hypothetical protein
MFGLASDMRLGGEVECVKAVEEPPHSRGRADRLGRRSLQDPGFSEEMR